MPNCDFALQSYGVKLLYNFIEITLRYRFFPINMRYIFRTTFPKNTSEGLLLEQFPQGGMYTPSLTSCIV